MIESPSNRKPTFFWQAVLIVLPVVVLAAVGIWALQTDRAAVERQAQARTKNVSAAVSAEIEKFLHPGRVEGDGVVYPVGFTVFLVSPSNTVFSPPRFVWPPEPMPLPAHLSGLIKPNKLQQWQAAETAFNARNWSQAIGFYDAFLEGDRPIGDFPGLRDSQAPFRAKLSNERLRTLALFRRAVAFEQSGDTNRAVTAYSAVITTTPVAGIQHPFNTRSEAGISLVHLAARKILDLTQDQAARLPDQWRTDAFGLVSKLEQETSPFSEELCRRIRAALEAQLASHDQRNLLSADLNNWERWNEQRRLATEVAEAGSRHEPPWPEMFWVDGRFPWLAVKQPAPTDFKNPLDQRAYVDFAEAELTRGLSDIVPREDRIGEFEVRVELAGREIRMRAGQKSAWQASALSRTDIPFVITATVADPAAFFAAQRRRQRLFSGLVMAAAGACVAGFFSARRAFVRQLQLNELKSNFVSSVSHELRAPIASVRLMAESLDRGKIVDAQKQADYFRLIVGECRRLTSLIENVLDFSRIDQGRKQYEIEATDLLALVEQTVKLMEPYATERQVALTVSPSNPQPATPDLQPLIDARAIQQALVNLLDNAIKHAPPETAVTIGLECSAGILPAGCEASLPRADEARNSATPRQDERGPIRLWVEDRGGGIPPEEHEKIFEPFYRRGTELRRETQGIGIGLTIVKHIVEAHGGNVTVRSAVGQGSRFTIELPVAKTESVDVRR